MDASISPCLAVQGDWWTGSPPRVAVGGGVLFQSPLVQTFQQTSGQILPQN